MAKELKVISIEELKKHNSKDSAWLAINGTVYDVTRFAMLHPGGENPIFKYAGQDCTEVFYGLHNHSVILKFGPRLAIGTLEGAKSIKIESQQDISTVPYGEPPAWQGFKSPYYNESHIKFRKTIRDFIEKEIREEAEAGEMSNKPPSDELFKKMGEFGMLAGRIGPGEHLKYVKNLPGGIKPEEFDYFHEGIIHEELGKMGCPGYADGLGSGMCIGLPPVINFGSDWMKEKIGKEVLNGEKRIALAITEPYAGSDVANIQTTAVKLENGDYLVNGEKKWITGGADAQYFTTAVRTGGEGMGGISLLLIERGPGVETKRIKTSYSTAAGTSYITFENVRVPAKNLIGMENGGFFLIMANFNHERWMICAYMLSSVRDAVKQTILWANQRKAFGKPLMQQPVVRQKIGSMIAQVESVYAWYEQITDQMNKMPYSEQTIKLSSPTSLLKYHVTRVAHDVADGVVQLFGGRSITQTGMGKYIERFQKTYKYGAILGGSEEVMVDLGVKLAMKGMPKNARL
eukprot:maker-scaffold_12-snap-gene-6.44-mRNA-1 protein AED:0.00 eAED:0.00 QI:206/1/1/1/1/1/2/452/516